MPIPGQTPLPPQPLRSSLPTAPTFCPLCPSPQEPLGPSPGRPCLPTTEPLPCPSGHQDPYQPHGGPEGSAHLPVNGFRSRYISSSQALLLLNLRSVSRSLCSGESPSESAQLSTSPLSLDSAGPGLSIVDDMGAAHRVSLRGGEHGQDAGHLITTHTTRSADFFPPSFIRADACGDYILGRAGR